jgi:hypothetical protein
MVTAAMRQDRGHRQRAEQGAELVERFMHTENPAITADSLRGMGQHHIARRIADRLAHPLEDDQDRGGRPAIDQSERRHGRHLQHIAEDRDGPELARRIGHAARSGRRI